MIRPDVPRICGGCAVLKKAGCLNGRNSKAGSCSREILEHTFMRDPESTISRHACEGDLPIGQHDAVSIACMFERIVERHADNVAVRAEDGELSYQQLNRLANKLAHFILSCANGRSERVALLFEQGSNSIVATFGALKAGSPFVPLDCHAPGSKLREICHSCSPMLLLCDDQSISLAKDVAGDSMQLVNLSRLPADLQDTNPEPMADADSSAYLFYTSGSTGEPKGVCQSHRNVLHFIRIYSENLAISANDRLSMLYSPAFSASNMDVFGALLNGATLCTYDIR